ncbi:hypothetical protein V3C99_000496, partial [Haemonchus contortus]
SKKVKRSASPKADKKKPPSPSPNPSPSPENKGSVKKVKKKKSPIIDPSDSRKLKKKKDPPSDASESKKRKQNDLERLYTKAILSSRSSSAILIPRLAPEESLKSSTSVLTE